MNLNKALDNAWHKIELYCQEKYAGVSTRDIQFSWKHDIYGWIEFGITPNGTPYIVRGDHATDRRSNNATWFFHPAHKDSFFDIKYASIEEIVKDWPIIKKKLEEKVNIEQSIFNFEP